MLLGLFSFFMLVLASWCVAEGGERLGHKYDASVIGGILIAWLNTAPETIFLLRALWGGNPSFAAGAISGSAIVVSTIALGCCIFFGARRRHNNAIHLKPEVREQCLALLLSVVIALWVAFAGFSVILGIVGGLEYILFLFYTLRHRNRVHYHPHPHADSAKMEEGLVVSLGPGSAAVGGTRDGGMAENTSDDTSSEPESALPTSLAQKAVQRKTANTVIEGTPDDDVEGGREKGNGNENEKERGKYASASTPGAAGVGAGAVAGVAESEAVAFVDRLMRRSDSVVLTDVDRRSSAGGIVGGAADDSSSSDEEEPLYKGWLYLAAGGLLILLFSDSFIQEVMAGAVAWDVSPVLLAFFLAPIASEAPEILESITLSRKGRSQSINIAFSNLIGGTVTKTTLLVGIYSISGAPAVWNYEWEMPSFTVSFAMLALCAAFAGAIGLLIKHIRSHVSLWFFGVFLVTALAQYVVSLYSVHYVDDVVPFAGTPGS